jgi:hypothetical protein
MKELPETEDRKILGLFRPKFGSREAYGDSAAHKAAKAAREGISETDYSAVKIVSVIVGVSVFAFLFGYSLSAWGVFPSVAAGMVFVSVIALLPLLLKAKGLHLAAALSSSVMMAVPLLFFGKVPLVPVAALAVFSAVMLTEGLICGKRELDNSLKASFTKFSGKVIAKAFTVVALAAAISYGWRFDVEDLFSDRFIDGIVSLSSPIVGYYAPGFTPEMKFGDFLEISARRALAGKDAVNFAVMPETLRRQLINQTVENSRRALENNFAFSVDLDASFEENFRTAVVEKLAGPAKAINPDHLSIAAAIIVFIFVRGILWLFGWLAAALAFFMYQLLLATKFAEIYLESKTREIVLLK